jgi:hypothetical protein
MALGCRALVDLYESRYCICSSFMSCLLFFQTIESSAREFLGKDKSTTLVACVVRYNKLLVFLCNMKIGKYKAHAVVHCRTLLIWLGVNVHLKHYQLVLG